MLENELFDLNFGDVIENDIRMKMPDVLDILLIDRTKSIQGKKNIIWANDNYIKYGKKHFSPESEITPQLITGKMGNIIKPRALKTANEKKERTKSKAEVFTPTWIVKKQNDEIDSMYSTDNLEKYINRKWLEITCGEGPYMASRYDMETGEIIPLKERVGFIDRKLIKICNEVDDKWLWQDMVVMAYKSSYGFEWSGDSLLIARENALFTYIDYFNYKWSENPSESDVLAIAEIISYNIFQMDGLSYTIPLSEKKVKVEHVQLDLFGEEEYDIEYKIQSGKRVKIMDWETNKMEFFDKGVEENE